MSEGLKFDSGKQRWDLLPYSEVEEIVKALTHGSVKYADNNWTKNFTNPIEGRNRYFAATMRHLVAWRKGKIIDQESGCTHLGCAMCNLIFLSWADRNLPIAIEPSETLKKVARKINKLPALLVIKNNKNSPSNNAGTRLDKQHSTTDTPATGVCRRKSTKKH